MARGDYCHRVRHKGAQRVGTATQQRFLVAQGTDSSVGKTGFPRVFPGLRKEAFTILGLFSSTLFLAKEKHHILGLLLHNCLCNCLREA